MGYLETQIEEIQSFLEQQEEKYRIAFGNVRPGTLNTQQRGGRTFYIHSVPDPDVPGRYHRRGITKDQELIRSLANKEFARIALEMIRNQQRKLVGLAENLQDITPSGIISRMKPAYQSLPKEFFDCYRGGADYGDIRQKWAEDPYEQSGFRPEERDKETSRGLMVRSKSEVLFCEKFYAFAIPFRYEETIQIGSYSLSPDFSFLDRNLKRFYLEYCGRMNDPEYVRKYKWRREMYESIDICEWNNMIYVYEKGNRISMKQIEAVIRQEILPRL